MDDWSVCRLCLQSKEEFMKSFHDVNYNMIPFFNIYFELVGTTLTEYPTFPGKICQCCEEELIQAYKFREKCLETEDRLKDLTNDDGFGVGVSNIEFITPTKTEEVEFPEKKPENPEELLQDNFIPTSQNSVIETQPCEIPEVKSEEDVNLYDEDTATDDIQTDSSKERSSSSQKRIVHKFSRRQMQMLELKNIQCRRCNQVFKGIELFKKHGCNHVRTKEEEQQKKLHVCDECGRSYTSRTCFNQHMDKHKNNKRYVCNYCDKKFFGWIARRTHIYKVHLKKTYCECSHCGKGFYMRHELTKHIRSVHMEGYSYQCEVCGKTFKRKDQLKDHEKIHEGKKTCKICAKELNSIACLRQHMRTHSNEKNYICPVCSKGFTCNFSMKTHVRKLHPDDVHLLPPDGTIVNQRYLKQLKEKE